MLRLMVIALMMFVLALGAFANLPEETTMTLPSESVTPPVAETISPKEAFRAKLMASPESIELLHKHGLQVAYLVNVEWPKYPTEVARVTLISSGYQRVVHFVDGLPKFVYICSTRARGCGKEKFGWYVFDRRERSHWSKMYHVAMPYAVHFDGNIFVHATKIISQLGRRASHGCIRLHPRDAKEFYNSNPVGTHVLYTA